MSNVRLLDTNTVNKIAAGEVVERPASCVKELIENAIDAGATNIEIEIINGGKTLMRVTDNGSGMNKDDALLAIRRHATSKLSNVKDLLSISTLGFRGEALPTIAAVSRFTIQTRQSDNELGTLIKIEGGKIIDNHETGCKIGTTVIVEDLFFNTPARLKFLKTTHTEANKIHDYVIKLAMSHPEITFKLISGGKSALVTPGNGNLRDVLTSVHGTEIFNSLIDVRLVIEDLNLSGFISKPNFLRSHRSWQTFIINGRVVNNRTISKAIEESYKALIPKSSYPLAVLKIEVPQNSIDVNVHPQKTEIKFEDENKIFKAVHNAIRDAISEKKDSAAHDLMEIAETPETPKYEPLNLEDYFGKPSDRKNFSVEKAREVLKKSEPEPIDEDIFIIEEKPEAPPIEEPAIEKNEEPVQLQPIGQIDLCYIVAQGGKDLYIIDQHAAHERILFDRLCSYAGEIPAQGLLIHRILKFDARETRLIEKNLELFHELGFTMELSGENEFRLVEVPTDAAEADPEIMLREIISNLDVEIDSADVAKKIRQSVLATTACRAAIKAGQELNIRQMQILLDDLSKTPNPYTCPHGRPTIIKFSSGDLAKMFHRT